jgi:hypothetical protein
MKKLIKLIKKNDYNLLNKLCIHIFEGLDVQYSFSIPLSITHISRFFKCIWYIYNNILSIKLSLFYEW